MVKKRRSVKRRKKSFPPRWKLILYSVLSFFLLSVYFIFFHPNISIRSDRYFLFISENATAGQVADSLNRKDLLSSGITFFLATKLIGLKPHGGLLEVKKNWNNYQLIAHIENTPLRPVALVKVPAVRNRNDIAKLLCTGIELKADSFNRLLKDTVFLGNKGFNKESVYSVFMPRRHKIWEDCSAEELFEKIYSEYIHFWNKKRLKKASELNLSPEEVMVLASIVYSETKVIEEMPVVAGVYVNRLQKKMRLESDPTLIFAHRKFDIRRVFNKHKAIDSPYNTYKNKGLPPGPIITTPGFAVDAVLNYSSHNYFYFCAKGDNSGCHVFAEDLDKHKENAKKYIRLLDSLKVK